MKREHLLSRQLWKNGNHVAETRGCFRLEALRLCTCAVYSDPFYLFCCKGQACLWCALYLSHRLAFLKLPHYVHDNIKCAQEAYVLYYGWCSHLVYAQSHIFSCCALRPIRELGHGAQWLASTQRCYECLTISAICIIPVLIQGLCLWNKLSQELKFYRTILNLLGEHNWNYGHGL